MVQWSTELPVAGSSFTYVMASLGQLPAFLVTSNMVRLQPVCHGMRVQRMVFVRAADACFCKEKQESLARSIITLSNDIG